MKRLIYSLITLPWILGAPLASRAMAQDTFTFSVDFRSHALAQAVSGVAQNINEGDVLTFGPNAPNFGVLANPSHVLSGAQLGLVRYSICLNHQPSTPCGIEVDAMSQGFDTRLVNVLGLGLGVDSVGDVWFSVDEWAAGVLGSGLKPNVLSEGGPVADASADIFVVYGLGIGPVPPSAGTGKNVGVFDGNGMPSSSPAVYIGIGLTEPNPPGMTPPVGDDLDALNIAAIAGFPLTGYYVSFDGSFIDPLLGLPNSGTAAVQGVSGADVMFVATPGGMPTIYASAASLGLDLAGPGTDDIDAMAIAENGTPGFQPSFTPYDWNTGRDMLLFSVRRGSAVIGVADSIFGVPIEPGDILTTPLGGVSGTPPGIMFAAESLGLATSRTNGALFGDDLNALDIASAPCFDCNNNGVEDAVDISTGGSSDVNGNGVPDECEVVEEFCYCPVSAAPCGNSNAAAGCSNSASAGAKLSYTSGNITVATDNLVITTTGVPPDVFGLYYMGGGQMSLPAGDGLACVSARAQGSFRYAAQNSGPGGVLTLGPGIVNLSCSSFPAPGCISAGDTWNFQVWYRDPTGPCGGQFNFSNGLMSTFVP